jgi:hypothetical protein
LKEYLIKELFGRYGKVGEFRRKDGDIRSGKALNHAYLMEYYEDSLTA